MKSSLKRLSISVLLLIPLLAVACSNSEPNSTKKVSLHPTNQLITNQVMVGIIQVTHKRVIITLVVPPKVTFHQMVELLLMVATLPVAKIINSTFQTEKKN